MAAIECLEGLVGVTEADCDCFPQSTHWEPASSGLYLSSLLDLKSMESSKDCGEGSLHDSGSQAINEAILGLQHNLLQCWSKKPNKSLGVFNEYTAQRSYHGAALPSGVYAGHKYTLKNIRHGRMKITGIHTLFTAAGTDNITALIYDNDELLYTVQLSTNAGSFRSNVFTDPIIIPFRKTGVEHREVYIIYQPSGANLPKTNEFRCTPCERSYSNELAKWATSVGVTGNTLEDRCSWSHGKLAYGLVPEIVFDCDGAQSICDGGMEAGRDSNVGVIAEYIWYMGAAKLADKMLKQSALQRYTVLPADELTERRDRYTAEALARLSSLCSTDIPIKGGCFTCDKKGGMIALDY